MTFSVFDVALSNLGSFVLGALVCRWIVRRGLTAAQQIAHTSGSSDMTTTSDPPETRPLIARVAIIMIVSALVFGIGVRVGYSLVQHDVSCFNQYANDLADSLAPRQTAAKQLELADKRQDRAIQRALTPGATRRDFIAVRKATEAKLAKRHELALERKENPYPDAPREVCQ